MRVTVKGKQRGKQNRREKTSNWAKEVPTETQYIF